MLQLQLYIEGEQVELYKDESVTYNQSIQDVRDIKKVFTDFSRTFSVPASKNNNRIFKHYYNYHIEGYDSRFKKDAELHLNYKPFKKGKVKLEGVTLNNNEAKTYKLTFFGNTVTIPDLLGDDRLANLTYLKEFNFLYNDTNIQSYMTDGLDAVIGADEIQDAIVFPLVTHTDRLIYDSSKNELNNLYPTSGADNGFNINQLKPALRLHAIIKAIELQYDIEFSTDFFNTDNDAWYNLYLWLSTKSGGLFTDQETQSQVTGYTPLQSPIDGMTIRNSQIQLRNNNRKVEYRFGVDIIPADKTALYNLVIHKNGVEEKRFDGLQGDTVNGNPAADAATKPKFKNGNFTVFIETEAATSFDLQFKIIRDHSSFLVRSQEVNITASLTTFSDQEITILSNLPNMKVLDFLTGIFQMFNLTAFVNDSGS